MQTTSLCPCPRRATNDLLCVLLWCDVWRDVVSLQVECPGLHMSSNNSMSVNTGTSLAGGQLGLALHCVDRRSSGSSLVIV
jgi:hypothetical protein